MKTMITVLLMLVTMGMSAEKPWDSGRLMVKGQ